MSLDYAADVLLMNRRVAATEANDETVIAMCGAPALASGGHAYLVKAIVVTVEAQGGVGQAVRLETAEGSPTVLGTLTFSDAADDTVHLHLVIEANREVAAGTALQLVNEVTDAAAAYHVAVYGTPVYQ